MLSKSELNTVVRAMHGLRPKRRGTNHARLYKSVNAVRSRVDFSKPYGVTGIVRIARWDHGRLVPYMVTSCKQLPNGFIKDPLDITIEWYGEGRVNLHHPDGVVGVGFAPHQSNGAYHLFTV